MSSEKNKGMSTFGKIALIGALIALSAGVTYAVLKIRKKETEEAKIDEVIEEAIVEAKKA